MCQGSPVLWKELAKEIRGNATLLKGFLGQLATLDSITDHRTQELAFEAAYRMWKARDYFALSRSKLLYVGLQDDETSNNDIRIWLLSCGRRCEF